jgi:Mrr N-terminal domain/Type I restriction enzyme R protein N terminus (HSDR_N)
MALPPFREMILPILRFGADGDINGEELRRQLPEIMKIAPEDLAILQPKGANTMFEVHVRFAIKGARERGFLENLGGKRYRITESGRLWLDKQGGGVSAVVEPAPPDGTWFSRAYHAKYRSEKEVDIRFVIPLLEHLGYQEDDRADGLWMNLNTGSRIARVQADFVCYNGPEQSASSCLLLVETKFGGASLVAALAQARSYAQVLKPLRLLVTDGDEIEVWRRSDTAEDTRVFMCNRRGLYSHFDELVTVAGKSVLSSEKKMLR